MIDDDKLRALYLRLLRAWNERDADVMADCFTDDGLMIGFDGSLAEGRETVRRHLAPIFADHPTAAYVTIIRRVRCIGDSGILYADVGMIPPGAEAPNTEANARQTITAIRTDGRWRVDLFQNTPAALHWDEPGRGALTADLRSAFAERGSFPAS